MKCLCELKWSYFTTQLRWTCPIW